MQEYSIEALALSERVAKAIELGESHFREFKSALHGPPSAATARSTSDVAKDVGEALVAFANADGGELLVGVEDDGLVSGIPYQDEDQIRILLRAPSTHVHASTPLSAALVARSEVQGKVVLYFAVDKSTERVHLTVAGRCLKRKDLATVPTAPHQIQFERAEQQSRAYDREYVDGALPLHLDHALLLRVRDRLSPGVSEEKCLQLLGLADFDRSGVRLRRASLLLFAEDIARWHGRCGIRVMRVAGTEVRSGADYNVVRDDIVVDNVLGLISKGWEVLRPHLVRTRLAGGVFEEQILYPEDACREALINAIAHRDYTIEGRTVEVLVFDDRMEIRSPGGLLSTVPLTSLTEQRGVHESRNALVSRVLRELGYMREVGEGIGRMYYLMRVNDLVPPQLDSSESEFAVVLSHKSAFSESDQRWIDAFEKFSLTRDEKLVVLLGKGNRQVAPQDIWDALNLVDTEVYRQIVRSLQLKGVLMGLVHRDTAARGARRRGTSLRHIARFAIRPPEEAEKFRGELLAAASTLGPLDHVTPPAVSAIRARLSSDNPYLEACGQSMRALGLVDESGRPMLPLVSVWNSRPQSRPQAPNATKSSERKLEITAIPDEEMPEPGQRTIKVLNLDPSTTQQELYGIVRSLGAVQFVGIPVDVYRGEGGGTGLVRMRDASVQRAVFDLLARTELRGRRLAPQWE